MHRWIQRTMTAVLAGLLLSCAAPAFSGTPTDQLKTSIDQVIQLVEDPALKAESSTARRRASIREAATRIFDFGEAAKRSLGRHWRSLPEADREEFVALFADLLERAYISKIEQYSGERIAFAGDSIESDVATVKTRFTTKRGAEVPVDYRMLRHGDRWLVYDVSIEGMSLVANYRGQFDKIIETSSYQELMKRMKARSDGLGAPSASEPKKKSPRS
jgi:phospholipid transport system substrate-binding protein